MQSQNYRYEFVSPDIFYPIFKQHRQVLFSHHDTRDVKQFYSEQDISKLDDLRDTYGRLGSVCLLVYDGDEVIAWSVGNQMDFDCFYMRNSAVYPQYRRQGIYSEMIRRMVAHVSEAGFQRICSRHHCSNNAVIIAKLKQGFVVSGVEVMDVFGTLVQLTYYPNEKRRELFSQRVGETTVEQEEK